MSGLNMLFRDVVALLVQVILVNLAVAVVIKMRDVVMGPLPVAKAASRKPSLAGKRGRER